MEKTTNLQLNKPALTDSADITKINENMDIIDEAVSKINNVTIINLSASWELISAGKYQQDVSVAGITENDTPILDIYTDGKEWDQVISYNDEWAKIKSAETFNGYIRFYADEATTAIQVAVKGV